MKKTKYLIFIFLTLISLNSCKEQAKPNTQNPSNQPTTEGKNDSLGNANLQQLSSEEEQEKKINDAQAQLDKNIPNVADEVFKTAFYKHFVGNMDNQTISLDLTAYGNGKFSGAFKFDNRFEVYEIGQIQTENKGILELDIYDPSSLLRKNNPISSLRGHLDLKAGVFKGYALNDSTLKPQNFDLKEQYADGALKMALSSYYKENTIKKVPNEYLLSRHFADPSVSADISSFLKANILKDIKAKYAYYYPFDEYDAKKFSKSLPTFTNFDTACQYMSNLHFKNWNKILTDDYKQNIVNEKGDLLNPARKPRISDNSAILYNSKNLLVLELLTWGMDGESYGDMTSQIVEYDLEQKKEITEKDVFLTNFDRNILYKALDKYYDFGDEPINATNYPTIERLQFSYFTDKAIVFCGSGNHGWMYVRYSLPIEDLKPILSPSFLKRMKF